jgi:dienelactone hydrolase
VATVEAQLHRKFIREFIMKPVIRQLAVILTLFTCAMTLHARLHTELIEYRQGDQVLQGYLAYDDSTTTKRPGVLVVHEWWGLNDYAKMRTEQLAALGFVAFAADIYGKGQLAKTPEEAKKLAGQFYGNPELLRSRVRAGLDVLERQPLVDTKRVAAIGYCFGGMTVLELARSGADVRGVVSFHGTLATRNPAEAKNIRGKVLVLQGSDDPAAPPEQVAAFEDEMRKGGVDWQLNLYGGAVHAFSNPAAGNDPSKGAAYNAAADRRSWEAMKRFFAEIF